MRQKFILPLLLIANISFGQFSYKGKIIDKITNQPIEGVSLSIEQSNKGGVSNIVAMDNIFAYCPLTTKVDGLSCHDFLWRMEEDTTYRIYRNHRRFIFCLPFFE